MPEKEGRLTKSLEDYLEAIYLIELEGKTARIKNIADKVKVKLPSATEAVKKLSKMGLVEYERYGPVRLTSEGKRLASRIRHVHEVLFRFLHDILGVDEEVANEDACKIEHFLHPSTVEKLVEFLEKHLEVKPKHES